LGAHPVSSSRGLCILGPMRALVSPSGSILVLLLLCFFKLENFIIYVSLCNSRIHVITLYSGHVCVYYASMLRCWHLVRILVRTDHPCLEVGCHTTLLQTQVTPNDCGIQRGSGCSLWAPCPNSGPRRWLSRCLCRTCRGHWPDYLPSSCSFRWWRLRFAAEREESQSHAERSTDECSAPLPHPGGVPSPFGGYPFSPRRP
jgi:hypothetical protein